MYSTKLTSVWNQQKTIFVRWKKKPTSVTSAKSFERVFIIIIFFFKFNAALMTDLSSRQELTISGVRFCDILHRFDFYMNFVFHLKFKKFYFLFYTINKKTQLPPFWFHQGDVLCYDSSTCM